MYFISVKAASSVIFASSNMKVKRALISISKSALKKKRSNAFVDRRFRMKPH